MEEYPIYVIIPLLKRQMFFLNFVVNLNVQIRYLKTYCKLACDIVAHNKVVLRGRSVFN